MSTFPNPSMVTGQALTHYKGSIYKIAKHVAKTSNEAEDTMFTADGELAHDETGGFPFIHSVALLLESDHRTCAMMRRCKIVKAFLSETCPTVPKEADEAADHLYQLLRTDPYLDELITSADVCGSLGRIKYIRDVLLPLQTNIEKVNEWSDRQKDMLGTLEQVSKALSVEVSQVLADVTAELKVAAEEKKVLEQEAKRLRKQQEKEAAKEAKRKKKEEAQRKAEEKAQREDEPREDEEEEDENNKRKKGSRRCRVGAVGEICETDPMVLRVSSKLPVEFHINDAHTDVNNFTKSIAEDLNRVQVCKARPATMKKVIQSVENISKATAASYIKQINSATGLN